MDTVSDLMATRYKVIAEYPDGAYKVGAIIHLYGVSVINEAYYDKYPHLFRKLSWWEDREEKDMPEYVKYWDTSLYFPVDRVCKTSEAPFDSIGFYSENFLPATWRTYLRFFHWIS